MEKSVNKPGGITPLMFFGGVAAIVVVILFSNGSFQGAMPLDSHDQARLGLAEAMEASAEMDASWGGIDSIGAEDRAARYREEANCIRNREGNC